MPMLDTACAAKLMADVRQTVRDLVAEKKFTEVSTLIQSAIRNGCVEHWMYEALSLALQASHAPPEELEKERLAREVPLGRLVAAREDAMFAAYLCSDASRFHSGDTIVIDGGSVIFPPYAASLG